MNHMLFLVIGTAFLVSSHTVIAASSDDIDKLTTYAVILGRAVACGNDIEDPMRRVGRLSSALPHCRWQTLFQVLHDLQEKGLVVLAPLPWDYEIRAEDAIAGIDGRTR